MQLEGEISELPQWLGDKENLPANVGDLSFVPSPGRSTMPPDLTNPVHHNY